MRLDRYLFEKGLAKSRTRAAEMIQSGLVSVDGEIRSKSSYDVADGAEVTLVGEDHGFVGRGGLKLDGALDTFGIDVTGAVCADVGASTGGFTDCLLKRGAVRVYAIDAGHGQLDESLKNDSRVVNIEGVNARYLDENSLPELCDIAVSDLSFISQTLVLPATAKLLKDGGIAVILVKPQFECGREALSKNGIVKDKKQHLFAVRAVASAAVGCGLMPIHLMKSPITGGDGNTEFLLAVKRGGIAAVNETEMKKIIHE